MAPKIEKVIDNVQLGEGPHWDAETQSLFFVDMRDQFIHKYLPFTRKHTKAKIGKNVSLIIPVKGKNDQFVVSIERELVLIKWNGETEDVTILEKLYEVDKNKDTVINDGKCDPSGRLWAGTMGSPQKEGNIPDEAGTFYSFQNKKATTHLSKIGISNGLAFDVESKRFYYVDSFKGTLDQYDFDIKNGTISNGKSIYTLNEQRGFSSEIFDGMTIDKEGNLWVAVFNGSKVVKINPRNPGVIEETVHIPARQVTSVTFGGPNLDELYVTSARIELGDDKPFTPDDGAVFKVTGLNAIGLSGVRIVL